MQSKKLLIIFIAFFFLTTLFSFNSVNAAEGDVTIVDWSGYNYNEHEGTGAIFAQDVTIHRLAGDEFWVANHNVVGTDDKCLFLDDGTLDDGWINLTTDYSYIGNICIAFEVDFLHGGGIDTDIVFYNDSIEVLALQT